MISPALSGLICFTFFGDPMKSAVLYGHLRRFIHLEAAGGIVLFMSALLALIVANSPAAPEYFEILHSYVGPLSLSHWINDALMAIFFLLIGLEIKREVVSGQLASWGQRIVPGIAAIVGMVVPALIFVAINQSEPQNLRGWAIPAATDIAFALGILAMLGSRVPMSLKILLTAIAVIDDLLAIIVIAVFYTQSLSLLPMMGAVLGLGILLLFNRLHIHVLWPYLLVGILVWVCVFLSGLHATLAGVLVALTIPMSADHAHSPLHRLEHRAHPWVAFAIVPLFGFANAGVSLAGIEIGDLLSPLPLGIGLGLFLGKQIGIFATLWLLARLRIASLPAGANLRQIYGMSILCGIGFTMSLFIGNLSFTDGGELMNQVKIGVLGGSILSGVTGWLMLRKPVSVSMPKG